MNFLSRAILDDRMTPLEYDLFNKVRRVAGVSPDRYEHVLMVDADTRVAPDSLRLLVYAMINDTSIMGICGTPCILNH
jgi:chitin synthase